MSYVWIDSPQIHGFFGFRFTQHKLRVPLCLLNALVVQKSPYSANAKNPLSLAHLYFYAHL